MANLTFGGNRLTFGGNVLVFGGGVAPPALIIQPGGFLPIIYLDRKGRPVDQAATKKRAVAAAKPAKREAVEAAFDRIDAETDVSPVVYDRMAAEMRAIAALLPRLEAALIADLMAQARELLRLADDERDIEILAMVC